MRLALLTWLFAAVLAVACQDKFRYPCQDPANHHRAECNPPKCEASGTCTKYLLKGPDEN